MEISEIKARLTLSEVVKHYGLQSDKYHRVNCPFHDDKTPSLQLYYKTQTAYCFSANCQTHGKSMDVIDFIMYKENSTKAEAINKAMQMLNKELPKASLIQDLTKTAILTKMFTYFKNSVHNSKPAREYIQQRGLDFTKIEIGYNTAQFHHGTRKEETLIQSCIQVGLLSPYGTSKTKETAYKVFAKECICFTLKNRAGQITGLYFRSTINNENQRHFYLKDREGLYPHYPKPETKKLILTESIIDGASLLQSEEVNKVYSILALYGTNGLTEEHIEAIKDLKELKEIIFFLNGDEAGRKATAKHAETLRQLKPEVIISTVKVPEKEDVNSILVSHEQGVFSHLLDVRIEISNELPVIPTETKREDKPLLVTSEDIGLNTKNPYKIIYTTDTANYYIQGGISKALDSMKVTLVVEHPETQFKSRNKTDLYEDKQVEKLCKEVAEKLRLRTDLLEVDIYKLTDLLDEYRERELINNNSHQEQSEDILLPLTVKEREQIENFAKKKDLIQRLNDLLGKTGIVGEEKNRIFLLLIAVSYKMPETLHALIQGSSGSGKTRLLKQISDCIPQEKVTKLTRVSDKVLYNYPEKYFINRLLCLEDIDGLSEEAEFAFRELQSNGELNSATSSKLENGHIVAGQKTVKGPIASLSCTTHGEIYEDNMSRVFLIAVDESTEQTRRIIEYQNNRAAGLINEEEGQRVKQFLQNFIRELKPCKVLNPFANKIQLPEEAHKIRRLNDLFQSFVKMLTLINQYQRKKDDKGRLLAEIADLETAIEIMFESIVLKVDELDGSLRQFYEKLKSHIEKKGKNYEFTRFEVREATGTGKTQQHHYINKLVEMEYIQQYGFANRGFKYKIVRWDNYKALREKIKTSLTKQLEGLKRTPENTNRTPEINTIEAN